ncbi:MAG: outer membrane protein transport protein [Burkholderiales bacterium]|nr:outer membrane protein transport protein [Burkholderiales bacterium]
MPAAPTCRASAARLRATFRPVALSALTAVGFALSASALASGYNFGTQSAAAQGSANANGAEAADASTVYANPAGMTRLKGTQSSIVLNVVAPHVGFAGSSTVGGSGSGGDPVDLTFVPHGYITHQINERYTVGLGLFVPFGAGIDYDDNFAGRYYGQQTELKTFNLNPSLGIKLNERHSVGLGMSAQYMKAKLVRKQNGLVLASRVNSALPSAMGGVAPDAEFGIEGDSWGVGFNLGYLFQPTEHTRFGVAWRSAINHKNKGDAYLDADALAAAIDPYTAATYEQLRASLSRTADGRADVKTPESLSFSAYHELDSRWAVMGDLTWTRHSRLQQIVIQAQPITTTYLQTKWDDTWRASIGTSYRYNDRLKVRLGYMYDQSPTDAASDVLPTMPDNDRQWLSLGASWQLDKKNSIDVAYSYIFIRDRSIDRYYDSATTPDVSGGVTVSNLSTGGTTWGRVSGEIRSHAQVFGVQWNHAF